MFRGAFESVRELIDHKVGRERSQKVGEGRRKSEVSGHGWLAEETFVTIMTPHMVPRLFHGDLRNLSLACGSLAQGLRTAEGLLKAPHIHHTFIDNVRAHKKEAGAFVDGASVDSVTFSKIATQKNEPNALKIKEFPNARTIWWDVPNWKDAVRGQIYESAKFDLQGLTNLKFRFYPAGKFHSKAGSCSLYVASDETAQDVCLRLMVGRESHILIQKMNADYVDGFANFCRIDDAVRHGKLEVGLEVIVGPLDQEIPRMSIRYTPKWASWTIPGLRNGHLDRCRVGDRFTSEVFSVDSMGEDACFVLYPKGDTVDSISSVRDFVNVGLFGGSDKDVTFRLQSGKVTKILTACADRYASKVFGTTKSCGEFFDSCFASLADMVDGKGDLNLTLDIMDCASTHDMIAQRGCIQWTIQDMDHLVANMREIASEDFCESRYFALKNVKDGFFSLGFRSPAPGEIEIALRKIHTKAADKSSHRYILDVSANDKTMSSVVEGSFNGATDTVVTRFSAEEFKRLSSLEVKIRQYQE